MPNSNGITPARAASENEHVTVFMKLKKNGGAQMILKCHLKSDINGTAYSEIIHYYPNSTERYVTSIFIPMYLFTKLNM